MQFITKLDYITMQQNQIFFLNCFQIQRVLDVKYF